MITITIFSYVLLIPFIIIITFLSIEIFIGTIFFNKKNKEINGFRPDVTILIPAHNESLAIVDTLSNLLMHTQDNDRVVVVADNCTDDTAELAKSFGVQVLQRNEPNLVGKGYALDFGIKHISKSPTKIIILLDADCKIESNTIDQLSIAALKYDKPIQALYLMTSDPCHSINQKISLFAFFIKNQIRPLGLKLLGLPCHLMGSGMAFPWHLISKVHLANSDLVEDMKLGIDFTLNNNSPIFLPTTKVVSVLPNDLQARHSQRKRWELGHLNTIKTYIPHLISYVIKHKRIKDILFTIDLSIPPISLLCLVTLLYLIFYLFISYLTFNMFYIISLLLACTLFSFSIMLTWLIRARDIISIREILTIPMYILSKLTIYSDFFKNKKIGWVKTKRDKKNDK
ncbi:glycosyltransferase family 2 protein [Pseudoalteromonas sp. C2R02]|uniref:glycosyltransferase family 2 protein n=1 Tax=Pseudoalteromonas sp. C2R02 TaxID=2841565 RepID=UPI001C087A3A|nr:glycosyltransferase family 2 protein [Pseudoalteromonas sp. C2R02]MBU2969554.1 glycosyltransferase family 2 protein [Pseudoalteromonas sp. C2R02]